MVVPARLHEAVHRESELSYRGPPLATIVPVSRGECLKMSVPSASLTTIGFDADDTLWRHEHYYQMTEARFAGLLAAEKRNLAFYGYGIKGFTLSMIETALELTGGRAEGQIIAAILSAGLE